MDQLWFEMRDIRRRKLATSVWIPLRAVQEITREGRDGFVGFKEEFFGAGSLAVPIHKREVATDLGWTGLGINHMHRSYIEGTKYVPCDVYEDPAGEIIGVHLVLEQRANRLEIREWHLHHDLVIALDLKREGDVWVSPDEGYIEVARLRRHRDGSPYLLDVRAEYLRDYLCAREMALYVTSYRSRQIVTDGNHMTWGDTPLRENDNGDRWEGRISEIHEGGFPFGAQMAVSHVSRTDVDVEEDVPVFGFPTNDDVKSESWIREHQGRKLYHIQGELWRDEWLEPAACSPRVRNDKTPPTVFFITNAEGKRESRETLENGSRWLWFRPDVIMVLSHRRGGLLNWYTRDTGSVRCWEFRGHHTNFGIPGTPYEFRLSCLGRCRERGWTPMGASGWPDPLHPWNPGYLSGDAILNSRPKK